MEHKPETRTIIVTGSNKGIGYGIVEGLCQQSPIPRVIMAVRNQGRGDKAREQLEAKYPKAKGQLSVAILDVGDFKSCEAFAEGIQKNFG